MSGAVPGWARRGRVGWSNTGRRRPDFAIEPGPGQESVWDYLRPPALVPDDRTIVVGDPSDPLASTTAALRVLETASPPTVYIPMADIAMDRLTVVPGGSLCEWKGRARYWGLVVPEPGAPRDIAWDYPEPFAEFAALRDHVSFYPGRIRCTIEGEVVRPQPGGFYGGWITDEIVGPFKGDPGTGHW